MSKLPRSNAHKVPEGAYDDSNTVSQVELKGGRRKARTARDVGLANNLVPATADAPERVLQAEPAA